jgi:hypothetical protein
MIVGNLFSSVRPKALLVRGWPSESVLFCDNVIVDAEADAAKLDKSLVDKNLGLSK